MLKAANSLLGMGLSIKPQRCSEYWRRYDQLVAKNKELVKVLEDCNPETGPIIDAMQVICAEISQHVRCCEQCQAWWRSFGIKAKDSNENSLK